MNVLIVENDESTRDVLCEFIEDNGFSIDFTGNAMEGIEKIESCMPHILLVDMYLDDGNALPLIKQCQSYYPETRIIVMTAGKITDDLLEGLSVYSVLQKPFDVGTLEKLLH